MGSFKVYGKNKKQIRARATKIRGKGNFRLGKLHSRKNKDGCTIKYAVLMKAKQRKKAKK